MGLLFSIGFSFPMGSCAGCSSPGASGGLPSCFVLDNLGVFNRKVWFGGMEEAHWILNSVGVPCPFQ